MLFNILAIFVGLALLVIGADILVKGASNIAKKFHIPEILIGLTIVAIGTALPEMVTSLIAVITGDADIAVGNLIGSSVLNSFLILGIGAAITPLTIQQNLQKIYYFLSSLLPCFGCSANLPKKDTLTRPKGLILVLIFAIYMVKLFV